HAAADEPATRQNRDRAIQALAKSKRYFIRSFFPDLFHAPDKHREVIESSATIAERMPVDQIIAVMKGMRDRKDSLQLLESIRFPVLFIGGEFDPRIPVSMIRSQSILPKGSELIILPNAAHMGHIEDFLLLSERILEFLNKLIATE
ncbi:MAG: alpha/beta hydrolase, partial [Bacteroidales bacterium]|nr:alpha/beta hydrolase [Bacteroidales bacterium]